MGVYVGLDVSLKQTSVCVIDESGKVVWPKLNTAILEVIDSGCLFCFSNPAWHYAASG